MTRSLALFVVIVFTACGKNKQAVSPQRKDLIEAVYASGNLTPNNSQYFPPADHLANVKKSVTIKR